MTLYYEGSDGSKVNLMGDGIYAQNPETLTQNTWEYSTMSGSSGLARVKRFYKENGHYRLQPENDSMDPIIVDSVEILGKVKGLIRMM